MAERHKEPTGAERRRDARYPRNVAVRVGHDADGVRAQSINISGRGLYCTVPRYVHPFSKLKVSLDLPFTSRAAATVECDGVVVRIDPDVPSAAVSEYRLAIYFLNLDRRDARLVEEFLSEVH
ncbi:MAG: PilZ domain-containing protein [Deferrisomatales bacterium]